MRTGMAGTDRADSFARDVDESATEMTGMSVFNLLTLASILVSVALFLGGRKLEAIFVGLWPPTFQALRSALENR
jgi:hypothetical protein